MCTVYCIHTRTRGKQNVTKITKNRKYIYGTVLYLFFKKPISGPVQFKFMLVRNQLYFRLYPNAFTSHFKMTIDIHVIRKSKNAS